MRAVMCDRVGGPEVLALEEVDDPKVGPGQVLVEVKAATVTFPDLLMLQDLYQVKPPRPFVPGAELAGVVTEVGEGVEGLARGDRVLAKTSASTGAMAELAVIEAATAIPLPDGVDFTAAAGLLYAYGTAQHALKDRARLRPGESLLVLGAAGSVGLAAVELGKAMGARVIAAASSEEKLQLCRDHGADDTIDYSHEDLKTRVRDLTGGDGADVVYDPVGGPFSEPALRSTAWEGRFLVIGFANGEIPRIPLNLALLRGCAIVGVYWGSFTSRYPARNRENVAELLRWWSAGRIRPHTSGIFPLEQAAEAFALLGGRKAMGKVVVTP